MCGCLGYKLLFIKYCLQNTACNRLPHENIFVSCSLLATCNFGSSFYYYLLKLPPFLKSKVLHIIFDQLIDAGPGRALIEFHWIAFKFFRFLKQFLRERRQNVKFCLKYTHVLFSILGEVNYFYFTHYQKSKTIFLYLIY